MSCHSKRESSAHKTNTHTSRAAEPMLPLLPAYGAALLRAAAWLEQAAALFAQAQLPPLLACHKAVYLRGRTQRERDGSAVQRVAGGRGGGTLASLLLPHLLLNANTFSMQVCHPVSLQARCGQTEWAPGWSSGRGAAAGRQTPGPQPGLVSRSAPRPPQLPDRQRAAAGRLRQQQARPPLLLLPPTPQVRLPPPLPPAGAAYHALQRHALACLAAYELPEGCSRRVAAGGRPAVRPAAGRQYETPSG